MTINVTKPDYFNIPVSKSYPKLVIIKDKSEREHIILARKEQDGSTRIRYTFISSPIYEIGAEPHFSIVDFDTAKDYNEPLLLQNE